MKILAALAAGFIAATVSMTAAEPSKDSPVYELRTYYAAEGKLDALHARFRDHTMTIFEKHGMKNVGYWTPVENPDNKLIYIIAHASREQADKNWAAFRDDVDWKKAKEESEANGKLVNKVENVFMSATDYSPMISTESRTPARIFELRTYTAAEGKLGDLNARFRDHTTRIFARLGMTNVGYWNPVAGDSTAGHTLIYMLAYPDREAARRSWAGFGGDAEWVAARRASEANGPLTVRGGVKSIYMTPTDYSPMK